jgi:hypothetical protein
MSFHISLELILLAIAIASFVAWRKTGERIAFVIAGLTAYLAIVSTLVNWLELTEEWWIGPLGLILTAIVGSLLLRYWKHTQSNSM